MNPATFKITTEVNNLSKKEYGLNWFIFYTYPRAEKVVYNELIKNNYEAFLPLTRTLRVWKNRKKKMVNTVLFPNYIFVNTEERLLYKIAQIQKISSYISFAGKPAIISIKCIDGIKKMLGLDQEIIITSDFNEGENVRIVYGPLAGYEGILVKHKGKTKFGIQLKEINQTMFIEVCAEVLEKV